MDRVAGPNFGHLALTSEFQYDALLKEFVAAVGCMLRKKSITIRLPKKFQTNIKFTTFTKKNLFINKHFNLTGKCTNLGRLNTLVNLDRLQFTCTHLRSLGRNCCKNSKPSNGLMCNLLPCMVLVGGTTQLCSNQQKLFVLNEPPNFSLQIYYTFCNFNRSLFTSLFMVQISVTDPDPFGSVSF